MPVVLETMAVSGEQPGPGLWKVSNGDHVLWIVGTQTPVPQKMTWRAKGIEAVVAQSQEILSPPSMSVSMKQIGWFTALTMLPSALQVRKNPDDAMLKDIVPPELHARWVVLRDKYIDSYDINDEEKNIEGWRPMFAALELYRKAINKSGLTSVNPVWPLIRDAAKKHNVKITEVKYEPAISEPRAALKELRTTRLADVDCFAKTIERIESDLSAMRVRANAWARGDIDAIRKTPAVDQRAACEAAVRDASFMKTLGTQNASAEVEAMWLGAAESALKNSKVALAVLPIAQVVSKDGYVAKLRARGYVVEEPDAE
ncbi:MAG: TraB/GumN family protein [Usitatibacteraceae bacterium]